jgi:hypothetical protein
VEDPFFLYYPMVLVHDPFVPTPDSIGNASKATANEWDKTRKQRSLVRRGEGEQCPWGGFLLCYRKPTKAINISPARNPFSDQSPFPYKGGGGGRGFLDPQSPMSACFF